MKAGVFIPNGIGGDFRGWEPAKAWQRALELGRLAESLGFESIRVPDHLQNISENDDAPTFEAFALLTALAGATTRVRLGPGVACVAFRPPSLLARMASTLDVVSGGRFELGLGAGWNEWEWRAYGFGYPPIAERLQYLRESLEIITRMFEPGRATFEGERIHVKDAVMEPKGVQQPRIPIIVGGNGPNVTWRLAAKFADELNLDGPKLDDIAGWLPTIRQRCEEIGRDPSTLKLSALIFWRGLEGAPRVEALQRMAELGFYRMHTDLFDAAKTDDEFHKFAEDCRAAGVEMAG